MMPALTYKMQGHTFNLGELHQIFKPLMHTLKHACSLPTTFPSTFMHHRLGGKVPRLETWWVGTGTQPSPTPSLPRSSSTETGSGATHSADAWRR